MTLYVNLTNDHASNVPFFKRVILVETALEIIGQVVIQKR